MTFKGELEDAKSFCTEAIQIRHELGDRRADGQGTGLGLSISYDRITKGHQGEISVDSEEGKGTTFTISLNQK